MNLKMPQTLVKSLREEKRREENFSAQLFLSKCFNIYMCKLCELDESIKQERILLWLKVLMQPVQVINPAKNVISIWLILKIMLKQM